MVSRLQRRMAVRRKLKVLRALTNSKSVRKSSILMDAFNYINQLKLKVEAMTKEYSNQINQQQQLQLQLPPHQLPLEVKVEKIEKGFRVRVSCEKGQDLLVSVLEGFEDIGIDVVQARVSCNYSFCMEAIVEAHVETLDVGDVTQAVFKALGNKVERNVGLDVKL